MAEDRAQEKAKAVERVWNFTQKILAPLILTSIIAGFTFLFGLGSSVRDISSTLDRELAPVDHKHIRDYIIDFGHELRYLKGEFASFLKENDRSHAENHRDIDDLKRRVDGVSSQCTLLAQKCDFLDMRSGREKRSQD